MSDLWVSTLRSSFGSTQGFILPLPYRQASCRLPAMSLAFNKFEPKHWFHVVLIAYYRLIRPSSVLTTTKLIMSPRFSQEIFDLFIDSVAQPQEIAAMWPLLNVRDLPTLLARIQSTTLDDLRACALVCQAWHSRTVKHLWSRVFVDAEMGDLNQELLRMFTARPHISAAVNFVNVRLSWANDADNSDPCFLALCMVLAPVTAFRLQEPTLVDSDSDGEEYHWRGDLNVARAIHSFCHSERITTLYWEAPSFRLQLLQHMPNLRDISLSGDTEKMIESDVSHNRFRSIARTLSFRLRRAHFLNADDVLKFLVEYAAHILAELEDLRFHTPYISQEDYYERGEFNSVFATALSGGEEELEAYRSRKERSSTW